MDSVSSPQSTDDFCLINTDGSLALPIRSKSGWSASRQIAAEQSEDEYDVVSRPGSVRSFGSPSPDPSEPHSDSILPAPATNISAGPLASCSCRQRGPPFAPCVKCTGRKNNLSLPSVSIPPGRGTLTPFSDRPTSNSINRESDPSSDHTCPSEYKVADTHECIENVPGTAVLAFPEKQVLSPSVSASAQQSACRNHENLDRAIMDRLISHAIESYNKPEREVGRFTEAQLAIKMLVRLLKLPPDHPVPQELVKLQPTLFHPLYRGATERRAIFEKVFTNIEQAALYAIVQGHKCNFRQPCVFADCLPPDVDWLSNADETDLQQAGRLASEVQMSCINEMNRAQIWQFLIGTDSDWQYNTVSAIRFRVATLKQGNPFERAAANVEILYSRDPSAEYQFAPGAAGFSSIEAMVIFETLNKALPDLAALKQLHTSRRSDPRIASPNLRLKREASNEDLASNGLASPPWKRVSLPERVNIPNLSAPYFTNVAPSMDPRAELSVDCTYPTIPDIQKFNSKVKIMEDHAYAQAMKASGYIGPPWKKPILDFEGDLECLGLHPNTMECLRHGTYPCYSSLKAVQQWDLEVKLKIHQNARAADYQQQLLLLEQQNRYRICGMRAENEKKCPTLQTPEEQRGLLKEQSKNARLTKVEEKDQEMTKPNIQTPSSLANFQTQLQLLEEQCKQRCALAKDAQKKEMGRPKDFDRNLSQQNYSYSLTMLEEENRKKQTLEREKVQKQRQEAQQKEMGQQAYQRCFAVRPCVMPLPLSTEGIDSDQMQIEPSWQQDWQTRVGMLGQHVTVGGPSNSWRWGQKADDPQEKKVGWSKSGEHNVADQTLTPQQQWRIALAKQRREREKALAQAAQVKGESLEKYQTWLMLMEQNEHYLREDEPLIILPSQKTRTETEKALMEKGEKKNDERDTQQAHIHQSEKDFVPGGPAAARLRMLGKQRERDMAEEAARADKEAFETPRRVW